MADEITSDYAEGSMAASLASAYDSAQSSPEPQSEAAEKEQPSEVEATDESASPPEEAAEPASEDEETTDQGADEDGEPDEDSAIAPPRSWSADVAEKWAGLDRATQEYILRREDQAQKAIQERSERLNAWKPAEEALAPLSQELAANGIQPGQFVERLVEAHKYLQRDPANAIKWLSQQYGVQAPAGDTSSNDDFADPEITALKREVDQLKGYLSEQQRTQHQQSQHAHAQQIAAFSADPKHEHFETVRGMMAGLMQTGAAETLDDAYQQAVWAHPETRKAMLEKQNADAAKMAQLRAAKAQKAAKASKAPNGTTSAPAPGKTMAETIRMVADEAFGA